MITITYTIDGQFYWKCFPETKKGNSDSVKFIQSLHDQRRRHPWYYKLAKIKALKDKLEDKKLGARTKKRYQLETELKTEEEDRTELLELLGINEAPLTIQVIITHN